jgi:prepilin-type N-terminal cleavage/methylation domain-containing protein
MRHGVTLVEMVVVLALLGVISGVVAVQLNRAQPASAHSLVDVVATLRRQALAGGSAQTIVIRLDSTGAHQLTAFPDGRVVADGALGVDLLTGIVP